MIVRPFRTRDGIPVKRKKARIIRATSVSVGLAAPRVGSTALEAIIRLLTPNGKRSWLTTPWSGPFAIRHVEEA